MDIGQVCLASIVIPFILDKPDIIKIFVGLTFSFSFWTVSVLLVKTKKNQIKPMHLRAKHETFTRFEKLLDSDERLFQQACRP